MSRFGQTSAVVVGRFELAAGQWFERHEHPSHQLALAPSGVLTVRTEDATWVLPPTLALWIPAGVRHETGAVGQVDLRGVYLSPSCCPVRWSLPTVVAVSPLLSELIEHLAGDLPGPARERAEAVLFDLLEPVPSVTVTVVLPTDPRARAVAETILTDPANDRSIAALSRSAGTSARTLARLFRAETGLSFGQWRTRARLQAALPLLAGGTEVGVVAGRVGYHTASAFVAAFHRTVGRSPGAYFGAS